MSCELEYFGEPLLLIIGQSRDGQEMQLWSTDSKLRCKSPLSSKHQLKKLRITKNGR